MMQDAWWRHITSKIRFVIEKQGGFWDVSWQLAAIMEELGELSRVLQEHQGIRTNTSKSNEDLEDKMIMELGDVFFALACLAITLNVNLLDALERTIQKYSKRGKS